MKLALKTIITGLVFLTSFFALAGDQAKSPSLGQKLHDEKCQACHTSSTYTRADHKITSLEALKTRVNQCKVPAKAEWSEAEQTAVVDYINGHFYKF